MYCYALYRIPVIPILVEGSTWGKETRKFPDLTLDVPESLGVEGDKAIHVRTVFLPLRSA